MPRFVVRFNVNAEVNVYLDAADEDQAAEMSWDLAHDRLQQIATYHDGVGVFVDLDGV